MGVTPASVGQLVRSLASEAGYPRFRRTRSGTQRLIPVDEVRIAIEEIALGLGRLHHRMPQTRWLVKWGYFVVTPSKSLRGRDQGLSRLAAPAGAGRIQMHGAISAAKRRDRFTTSQRDVP